ncbi:MAG: aminotransferase class I/II-fold pyridoxal phosphate-dependent enzyme, partial [Thermodesulfobacteriota bacterium]
EILKEICSLNMMIISDEIYHGLVYGKKENTVLEFTDNAIVVSGFSKLYSMTGWRLGYMIVPPGLVRYVQKLQQNLFICANPFVQFAGVEAIEKIKIKSDYIATLFNERRLEMIKGLRSIGFEFSYEPSGAFYIYVNSSRISDDSYELAFNILRNSGVAVTPGIDFSEREKSYLRFSYATSVESIKEGINRLAEYL